MNKIKVSIYEDLEIFVMILIIMLVFVVLGGIILFGSIKIKQNIKVENTVTENTIVENVNTEDIFEVKKVDNAYEMKDKSWFILDKKNNKFIFQAIELGDWDYECKNIKELKNIVATYYIQKYNIETDIAIAKVNEIFESLEVK